MVERKQEPPWGGIKQLNFPLRVPLQLPHSMEKVTEHYSKISLKQDVQQRWDMTCCLGTPQRPRYL